MAALSLTACVNDEDNSPSISGGKGVISFGPEVSPMLRATQTGATAATTLGNKFYVFGIKNESREGAGNVSNENLVFRNYKVAYTTGSANTSTTNTSGWEYVGVKLTDNEAANLMPNPSAGDNTQTVKYWDTNADDYTFYAIAVANNDLEDGNVAITKTTDYAYNAYRNGYSVALKSTADPTALYIADRYNVTATGSGSVYGDNVTFTFRNAMAKVRVAMYETVPGYTLTLDAFRIADNKTVPSFGDMTTAATGAFSANLATNKPGHDGTMTVIYKETGEGQNMAQVAFDATKDNVLTLGDNLKAGTQLTNTSATALYDHADGTYTTVYPMEDNNSNLKLKVDFTLHATTGETIKVTDATAEVPAAYLKWRPGYAYTYIFKISDQTNATVGSLTGLYPITFDAVMITDGIGEEEKISTTGTGTNIITMGYDQTAKTVVVGKDDYAEGNTIYASIVESDNIVTPTNSNAKLYTVTTNDPDNHPATEATVAEYLTAYAADNTLIDQPVTAYDMTLPADAFVNTVPISNGDTRTLDAVKWTAQKHVYAVEYTNASGSKSYKIVRVGGYDGKTSGTLTLNRTTVSNMGGDIKPLLKVDDETISNQDVTYALDYAGTYGLAVPTSVIIDYAGTDEITVSVPAGTAATTGGNSYTLIATYGRRTYTTSFTVSQ